MYSTGFLCSDPLRKVKFLLFHWADLHRSCATNVASAVKCHPEFALQSNPEFDSAEYNKPLPSVGFDTNYSVPVLHDLSNSDLELDHCAT